MSVRYQVVHDTVYRYRPAVRVSRQILRLTPRDLPWQRCLTHDIQVSPAPRTVNAAVDYFGNRVRHFSLEHDHDRLLVQAQSSVELTPRPIVGATPPWEAVRDRLTYRAGTVLSHDHINACAFLFESLHVPVRAEYANYTVECFTPGRRLLDALLCLTTRIYTEFTFDPNATTISTPVSEVFLTRRGVCQDFAHLMLACLRSIGLAARYVSGYLRTVSLPGRPRLIGADASHAWVSVYCPLADGESVWLDVDPTNNVQVDINHITLAWGRDYPDVSPVRGVLLGGDQQTLRVGVTVMPADDYQALLDTQPTQTQTQSQSNGLVSPPLF